ncbi:MAG: hypothetical protein ABI534_02240 [Chloroflexota bacterium]
MLRALAAASGTDPELGALWREIEEQRFSGQSRFVGMLAERGSLRPSLSLDDACAVTWTLCSLAVHDQLVLGRGWTEDQYRDWLADALARELLP